MDHPSEYLDAQEQFYYTLIHGKPFIGAFFTSFVTPPFRRAAPALGEFPSEESIRTLEQLQVRYVVVDVNWYAERHLLDDVRLSLEVQGLKLMENLDGLYIFLLE